VGTLPARTLILDGEICRFDDRLVSRFEWLHDRPNSETATTPMLMAFDCL
jgi:ATP-dependent DNA ligase